jgi:hypothetical protein
MIKPVHAIEENQLLKDERFLSPFMRLAVAKNMAILLSI